MATNIDIFLWDEVKPCKSVTSISRSLLNCAIEMALFSENFYEFFGLVIETKIFKPHIKQHEYEDHRFSHKSRYWRYWGTH
jgi:hypothetical protein